MTSSMVPLASLTPPTSLNGSCGHGRVISENVISEFETVCRIAVRNVSGVTKWSPAIMMCVIARLPWSRDRPSGRDRAERNTQSVIITSQVVMFGTGGTRGVGQRSGWVASAR